MRPDQTSAKPAASTAPLTGRAPAPPAAAAAGPAPPRHQQQHRAQVPRSGLLSRRPSYASTDRLARPAMRHFNTSGHLNLIRDRDVMQFRRVLNLLRPLLHFLGITNSTHPLEATSPCKSASVCSFGEPRATNGH